MSRVQSSATWSVDGSPPTEFKLPGPPAGDVQYRTKFFETPKLAPGPHILDVVYKGDVSQAPLTLWQLYIDHGGVPDSLSALGGGEAKSSDVKIATVGAALGAALVVAIGALIFLFIRFRKRDSRKAGSAEYSAIAGPPAREYAGIQPYDPQVINASGSQPVLYDPPQQGSHETMYTGQAHGLVTQPAFTPRTRAVPPALPMRTGKGFVQTRNTRDTVTPTLPSSSLGPESSYGGSSVAREEHPPVYSPDR